MHPPAALQTAIGQFPDERLAAAAVEGVVMADAAHPDAAGAWGWLRDGVGPGDCAKLGTGPVVGAGGASSAGAGRPQVMQKRTPTASVAPQ